MSFKIARISQIILFLMLTNVYVDVLADNSENNSSNSSRTFGGPDAVENQIESDGKEADSMIDFEIAKAFVEFREDLKEKFGITFGLDYSYVYSHASEKLPGAKDDAASGMARFFGAWDLIGRDTGNTGALVWKGEHRHRTNDIPAKDLSFETGYVGIMNAPFNNDDFRLTNLYWRQRIQEPRVTLTVGFLDVTDYVDAFALGSPWLHFNNLVFSTGSATIDLPSDATLGVSAGAMLSENVYLIAGVANANSDPTDPLEGFDSIDEGEYFKSIELGWTSSADRIILDNAHLTYWHINKRDETGVPDGWGLNFSASYFVTDTWMPFLRGGYTEDSGSLLESSASLGLGYQSEEQRNQNLLGFAVNWGEPNEESFGSGLDDQYTFELFYRLQLTKEIAVTPDIQYVIDPALNPDENSIWYFGLRSRIAL